MNWWTEIILNIKIRKRAKKELKYIRKYISKDSIFYANKTVDDIIERISNLSYFPEMGKQIEINHTTVRQIIYKSYRIFYQVNSNNIYILSIFHHSRDISNLRL